MSLPPSSPPRQRVFLGWHRPALPQAAAWLVEAALAREPVPGRGDAEAVDLSPWRVVLPGARAARRLLELLLDEAEARGRALLPPELVTTGALPERLHPPRLPAPHPQVEAAAWRVALSRLPPRDREHLLPGGGTDPEAPAGLAPLVAGLHTTVGAEGVDFDEVVRRCRTAGDLLLFNDEVRWGVLAGAQRRFRALLAAEGLEDREGARARALAEAAPAMGADRSAPTGAPSQGSSPATPARLRPLVLVGVVDPPGVVRRMLEAYPGEVTALVHAPPELADHFDALGAVEPAPWEARSLAIPEGNLRVVTRPDEQAAAAVAFLRGLRGARAPEEVTVGVPDEALVSPLQAALGEVGVPSRAARGRPMHRTPPWRLLDAVAHLLEGWDRDALAALLRHPGLSAALSAAVSAGARAGRGEQGGPDPVVVADRYQARHLQAVADGYVAGAGREGGAFQALRDAVAELLRQPGLLQPAPAAPEGTPPPPPVPADPRPLRAWATALRELVIVLHPGRTVDREAPRDRELAAFLEAVRGALEGFEALPPALDPEPVHASRALRLLLEAVGEQAVPPAADESAVELLGWLELHLDDAPELVVTGVNEPHLPQSVPGHPFLPHALQSLLGLPDNRRRTARDRYLLEAILASRPGTVLVAGRRDAEGNPLRLSRLLLAESGPPLARRVLALLGEEGAVHGQPQADAPEADVPEADVPDADVPHADVPQADPATPTPGLPTPPTPFLLPPEPELQAGLPPDRIAVTTFRAVLADPYRYALERVLGLEALTDEARELDPMGFGILAHEVVERWARIPGAHAADEAEIFASMERILEERFQAHFGRRPLPALHLQREQLRVRLRRLAAVQAERNAQGWRIVHVEAGPPPEVDGVPFEVDGEVVYLRGRIDRIDHHPASDRWQLLDLKTSEGGGEPDGAHRKRGRGGTRWVDLQLPLYRHLARGLGLVPAEAFARGAVETGYLLLPGAAEQAGVALASWTPEELAEADEVAREVVRTLRANRFVWDPATSAIRDDDPLAVLVGRGVLPGDDEDDAGGGSHDDA